MNSGKRPWYYPAPRENPLFDWVDVALCLMTGFAGGMAVCQTIGLVIVISSP
jgi:hypothetical protein